MNEHSEVTIRRDQRVGFRLNAELTVNLPCEEVFEVFSDATKLESITPPWLDFSVLTPLPIEMKEGLLLDYRLKIHHVPVRWRTEICQWQPPFRFVDQQLIGPYKRWFHEHTFEDLGAGRTLVRDNVHYIPRGGWLVHELFVRRDLEKIFRFRQDKLREIFAAMKSNHRYDVSAAVAPLSPIAVPLLEPSREFNPRQDRSAQSWRN